MGQWRCLCSRKASSAIALDPPWQSWRSSPCHPPLSSSGSAAETTLPAWRGSTMKMLPPTPCVRRPSADRTPETTNDGTGDGGTRTHLEADNKRIQHRRHSKKLRDGKERDST